MNTLRTLDLVVIAIYFVAVAFIGLRFARRQTTTEAYFVARRSIPAWAMGLSVFATIISSITFIAYPGAAFKGNFEMLCARCVEPVPMPLSGSSPRKPGRCCKAATL